MCVCAVVAPDAASDLHVLAPLRVVNKSRGVLIIHAWAGAVDLTDGKRIGRVAGLDGRHRPEGEELSVLVEVVPVEGGREGVVSEAAAPRRCLFAGLCVFLHPGRVVVLRKVE